MQALKVCSTHTMWLSHTHVCTCIFYMACVLHMHMHVNTSMDTLSTYMCTCTYLHDRVNDQCPLIKAYSQKVQVEVTVIGSYAAWRLYACSKVGGPLGYPRGSWHTGYLLSSSISTCLLLGNTLRKPLYRSKRRLISTLGMHASKYCTTLWHTP